MVSHRAQIYVANDAKTNSLELDSAYETLQRNPFLASSYRSKKNRKKWWKEQTYMSIIVELIVGQFQFIEWYSSPHPMSTERGRIGMNERTTGQLNFTWVRNVLGMIQLFCSFLYRLNFNFFCIFEKSFEDHFKLNCFDCDWRGNDPQ